MGASRRPSAATRPTGCGSRACRPGKPAITHWQVLDDGTAPDVDPHGARVSLVTCRLETGRTHQIRVHMSYAGAPVVGDRLYGARRDLATALGVDRCMLHAVELGFRHPVAGEDVHVEEAPPEDLARGPAPGRPVGHVGVGLTGG